MKLRDSFSLFKWQMMWVQEREIESQRNNRKCSLLFGWASSSMNHSWKIINMHQISTASISHRIRCICAILSRESAAVDSVMFLLCVCFFSQFSLFSHNCVQKFTGFCLVRVNVIRSIVYFLLVVATSYGYRASCKNLIQKLGCFVYFNGNIPTHRMRCDQTQYVYILI